MHKSVPGRSELHAISYTSSAVHVPSRQEIAHLLSGARKRNEEEGVTGVLLYAEGTFYQYIEGPGEGLGRVYGAICRDPLHRNIWELERGPIARRQFAKWSMGYHGAGAIDGLSDDQELTALLSESTPESTPARSLLRAFWEQGGGRRYKVKPVFGAIKAH